MPGVNKIADFANGHLMEEALEDTEADYVALDGS